jgi:hypothetical protein
MVAPSRRRTVPRPAQRKLIRRIYGELARAMIIVNDPYEELRCRYRIERARVRRGGRQMVEPHWVRGKGSYLEEDLIGLAGGAESLRDVMIDTLLEVRDLRGTIGLSKAEAERLEEEVAGLEEQISSARYPSLALRESLEERAAQMSLPLQHYSRLSQAIDSLELGQEALRGVNAEVIGGLSYLEGEQLLVQHLTTALLLGRDAFSWLFYVVNPPGADVSYIPLSRPDNELWSRCTPAGYKARQRIISRAKSRAERLGEVVRVYDQEGDLIYEYYPVIESERYLSNRSVSDGMIIHEMVWEMVL